MKTFFFRQKFHDLRYIHVHVYVATVRGRWEASLARVTESLHKVSVHAHENELEFVYISRTSTRAVDPPGGVLL